MIFEATIPEFSKMLNNLSAMLDKASQSATDRNFEAAVFLSSRLAPDQFNFTRQVQIACDTAKFAAALLASKEAPAHPDTEQNMGELKARIEKTVAYLNTFKSADFEGAAERRIARPRWEGKTLSGQEFLIQHAIPNFHFHVTTAYAILRHNGVNLGKKDYLGPLPLK